MGPATYGNEDVRTVELAYTATFGASLQLPTTSVSWAWFPVRPAAATSLYPTPLGLITSRDNPLAQWVNVRRKHVLYQDPRSGSPLQVSWDLSHCVMLTKFLRSIACRLTGWTCLRLQESTLRVSQTATSHKCRFSRNLGNRLKRCNGEGMHSTDVQDGSSMN
ncbi:hypothetical protein CALVIDRAFT_357438 [Calocera viscosa TUFC12733]|uniref:Uncharacterized protein n=1 Tax=Calocera viscosa (strain TUFC12733) TaxID=1330018 RepID=A0A167QFA5_CALVF|nr:hypothetical protein CALVIDRAFT_357438 [Calocera viscosa TUFC12733]